MRTFLAACALAALTLVTPHPVIAAAVYANHPLVGSWRFEVPNTGCAEVYRFRGDGTSVVTSGSEIAESEFQISTKPSSQGFYVWTDTIVKDNGKHDCSGQITEVGRKTTNYIRFDRSGRQFIVCRGQSFDACFGPFRRMGGDAV